MALGWMADVMPMFRWNSHCGTQCVTCILLFMEAGETATVADVKAPCDRNVGRCYAWVVDGKTTIIKSDNSFKI